MINPFSDELQQTKNRAEVMQHANKGVLFGFLAYLMWGFFPLYFKALNMVPPVQIIAHRFAWSFLIMAVLISLRKEWGQIWQAVRNVRTLGIYALAICLLALNWLIFIWAVNDGHVIDASLGYFINPLLSVALGVIFLRERLRLLQWLPVGLAGAGVLYLTVKVGSPPWIALSLAGTFGLYGLVKKVASLEPIHSLTIETGVLFLPSCAYLLLAETRGVGAFGHIHPLGNLLLAVAGLMTCVPLLLFSTAARSIPLTLVGLLQFVTPTCQFLLGTLLYREPFSSTQLVAFSLIWLALIIFSVEGIVTRRRSVAVEPVLTP